MKKVVLLCGAVLASCAAPVFAGDGEVPMSTLRALGLHSLQLMPEAEGMHVRGFSSSAFAFGASSLSAQLSDPSTPGNFIVATDVNGGRGTDENGGFAVDSLATQGPQGSSVATNLTVESGNPLQTVFNGVVLGNAGNASNIGAAGISAATAN
jgi:hypothetical protein